MNTHSFLKNFINFLCVPLAIVTTLPFRSILKKDSHHLVIAIFIFIYIVILNYKTIVEHYKIAKENGTQFLKRNLNEIVIVSVMIISQFIFKMMTANTELQQEALQIKTNRSMMIQIFIIAILLAPFYEEVLFRYSIMNFKNRKTMIRTSAISILLFTVIHQWNLFKDPITFITYLFISACLANAYRKEKNIFVPIVIHSLANLLKYIFIFVLV